MWKISHVINKTEPRQAINMSDGLPIDARRGGVGNSFRMIVSGKGFLDITDMGHQPAGPHYWQLIINGAIYWYDGDGTISLTINNDGSFSAEGDGNHIRGNLLPLPGVSEEDSVLLDQMMAEKIVPYQNIPDDPGKTTEELEKLGKQFFPYTPYNFQLAMSVYDWTTPDFARFDFFRIFIYTGVEGCPLDKPSIANAIWTSSWPPFTPKNKDYMNSFMMTPASSLEDVSNQLDKVADKLYRFNEAELRLFKAAVTSMPRTSILAVPQLFSGQVAISNLGTQHFAPEFLQFPGNKGPLTRPLEMPLHDALDTFIQKGKTITTKAVMSFTNSQEDAMHYQNGILIVLNPPPDAVVWEHSAYITPLSDGPEKTEYTFPPGTSLLVKDTRYQTVQSKTMLVLTLELSGLH
jgi:hypothetical protein